MRAARSDRGSTTLELVVLAPALLALLGGALLAARYEAAAGAVEQASAAAARAASLARGPAAQQATGRQAADAALDQHDLHCTALAVDVQVAPPRPLDRPAGDVTVTVACTLTMPWMPGTRRITASTTSVVDTYRSAP